MPPKPKESNKCSICEKRGQKGYIKVPKEDSDRDTFKNNWLDVIHEASPQEVVSPKTRVCWRHFSKEEIWISEAGYVKLVPGMLF